jgi:quercetin dioxygenase-like cupin family protein
MNIKTIHAGNKEVSAKVLFKGDIGTATAIQLQENGVLKEHITKTPALLLCIVGIVIYEDETKKTVELAEGDYVNIQPNIKHWLRGQTNSHLILLK